MGSKVSEYSNKKRTLTEAEKNVILKNDAQRIASEVYIDCATNIIYKRYTLENDFEEIVRIRKIVNGDITRWLVDVAHDKWTNKITATYF